MNSATGKGQRVYAWMMIPSAVAVHLRGSTKVGQKYNQGLIKHPSHLQIGQKCGHGTIKNRQ